MAWRRHTLYSSFTMFACISVSAGLDLLSAPTSSCPLAVTLAAAETSDDAEGTWALEAGRPGLV